MAYACFGSSRVLAVGPVAVISLMTATALADVTSAYDIAGSAAAALLALLSGCFLFLLGLLRMGWIANFLSHAVISGFISASALFIAFGQLPQILGIDAAGDTLVTLLPALIAGADAVSPAVAWMGGGTIAFLVLRALVWLRCSCASGSTKTSRGSPSVRGPCSRCAWAPPSSRRLT